MQQLLPRASMGNQYPISRSLQRRPVAEGVRMPDLSSGVYAPSSRLGRISLGALAANAPLIGQQISTYGSVGAGLATAGIATFASAATASSLIPIVGPAIAAVSVIVGMLVANSGCGQTCVISTDLVNKLEPALRDNVNGYLALPTPRPRAAQVAALANFDSGWNWLQSSQACGAPQLGDAGKRCISDRASGSCVWKDSSGKCWNWFVGYRDPIANDTQVTDSAASDAALSQMAGDPLGALSAAVGGLGSNTILLVGAALLVLGALGGD